MDVVPVVQDELETVQDSYSYVLNEMVALSKKSINKLDGDDLETNYSKKTYKKIVNKLLRSNVDNDNGRFEMDLWYYFLFI